MLSYHYKCKVAVLDELHELYGKLLTRERGKAGNLPEDDGLPDRLELIRELVQVHRQLAAFEKEKSDLEAMLHAAIEHGDLMGGELYEDTRRLIEKLERLEREKQHLETTLTVTTEHGDLMEQELYESLQKVLQRLSGAEAEKVHLQREKQDLQVVLETITEAADTLQEELFSKGEWLEAEVAKRTSQLAERNRLLQTEIDVRHQAEIELNLAAMVFEASHEAIIITDPQARIIKVNQAYTNITGYRREETLGRSPSLLKSGRHEESFYRNMWQAICTVGYWSGEVWNRRKSQEVFSCWLSISAVRDAKGNTTHYIGILADSTNQKLSEKRINYLAHYDALTDLPNRVLFMDRLVQAARRSQHNRHWIALMLVDLDNFKDINEAFGHQAGDTVLCTAARRMVECLDGEYDPLARLGSDEFAIVVEYIQPEEALEYVAHVAVRVLEFLNRPLKLEGHDMVITASIGITFCPHDSQDVTELMQNAASALNDAKQTRNSYSFYTHAANLEVRKRLTLQNSLRRALERNELLLYYQPQVALSSGRIIGVEALMRWQHPEQGWISPCEFIPLAERTNLIVPMGEWALVTACRQQQAWQAEGLPPLRMAVNLSVKQFYHTNLVESVADILSQTGLAPEWLELEITESLAMQKAEVTVRTLHALKELGISLAVDDFGTGYSSLSYLQQFTVDALKIDASFIARLHNPNGATLVASIVNMAHNLHMEAVAEGVETRAQLDILRAQQCDVIQGFYFAKPMPASELCHLFTPSAPTPQKDAAPVLMA